MDRRDFLAGATALTAWALKDGAFPTEARAQVVPGQVLIPSIWSRHVQWVRTQAQTDADPFGTGVAVGQAILAGGYTAVDLTVRDGGHVRPALVATNLPLMLNGIRSTGAMCTMIGTNFGPPSDPTNTAWIADQFVNEILSVAGANGITQYRYNNAGNTVPSFPANTYGAQMTALLDGVRVNHRRLAALNATYGNIRGVAHTHGGNIGTMVEPYAYSMQGIDPKLIGINFAMDHVAPAAPGDWPLLLRRWMPYVGCVAVEDLAATVNATTGALSIGNVQPPGATGLGAGVVNWATFYSTLRLGGYSGFSESQLEYSITGGTGTSISLNNADYADSADFTSGRLTPAIMIAEFKRNSDFIRARALAGGWTAAQIL
jgi:sugar phosphate isomerase/epimerase